MSVWRLDEVHSADEGGLIADLDVTPGDPATRRLGDPGGPATRRPGRGGLDRDWSSNQR